VNQCILTTALRAIWMMVSGSKPTGTLSSFGRLDKRESYLCTVGRTDKVLSDHL